MREPLLVSYFEPFAEPERSAKALEALKVGVIAVQTACPTLDSQIVKDQFAEMQQDFGLALAQYFAEKDGIVPKSLNDAFGEKGALPQFFQRYFDPETGRLVRLMDGQVGPSSRFAKLLDPRNKDGVIAAIEDKVKQLVETKLNEVLTEFSLDEDGSAMSRLKGMLSDSFAQLNQSLGIKAATAAEAERGHVKGMLFEEDLYEVFAEAGRQIGDETELVRGTVGSLSRCKKGDYVATLGETSGAPGQKVVVEVKDQPTRLKDAIDDLQDAKKNREAACGIFVFARGCEPVEIGDFRRIGEDFYVTVDKDDLTAARPLLFLDAAYKIARALTVAAARKDEAGELDLQKIQDQVNALAAWSDRIADMATKARTIQNSGKLIEQCANELMQDLDTRLAVILEILQQEA